MLSVVTLVGTLFWRQWRGCWRQMYQRSATGWYGRWTLRQQCRWKQSSAWLTHLWQVRTWGQAAGHSYGLLHVPLRHPLQGQQPCEYSVEYIYDLWFQVCDVHPETIDQPVHCDMNMILPLVVEQNADMGINLSVNIDHLETNKKKQTSSQNH